MEHSLPASVTNWMLMAIYHGQAASSFFFHEYGRRVGMVPRSSLKGGKNSRMVEKITRTTTTTQKTTTKGPQVESPPSCSLSSVLGETGETKKSVLKGPELTNEKRIGAGLCSSKVAKRLQKDLTSLSDQRPHSSAAKSWSRCNVKNNVPRMPRSRLVP